jgi:hypothetical protein
VDPAQVSDQCVVSSIDEVLLSGITRHVVQWQHRQPMASQLRTAHDRCRQIPGLNSLQRRLNFAAPLVSLGDVSVQAAFDHGRELT